MNDKRLPISLALLTISVIFFANRVSFGAAADAPQGWFAAGGHLQNYEMSVDTSVKHG